MIFRNWRGLVLLAAVSTWAGCIFGVEPGVEDPSPEDASTFDAVDAVDAADTGEDDGTDGMDADAEDAADAADALDVADGEDGIDGGDADAVASDADGGGCLFLGKRQGVCSNGRPMSGGVDADAVPGDADAGDCAPPPNYVPDEGGTMETESGFEEAESCDDQVDNDCDGVVNENCFCNFAGRQEGVCKRGTVSPEDGDVCQPPENYVTDETNQHCDPYDNDCDGATNEGCACNYAGLEKGVCEDATRGDDGECRAPSKYEQEESTCDGIDNDCDGDVDEGIDCTCVPGDTKSCYTGKDGTSGVGRCEPGVRECTDEGDWSETCDGETVPADSDTCDDDVDNDCDGTINEGCSCEFDGKSTGVCGDATIGSSGECEAPETWEQDESTCDGADNDCDGKVDEGCPCDYQGDSTGVCSDGTKDGEGNCTAPDTYESDESSCDGADNDCDGTVDEGCECLPGETEECYLGPDGTEGVGICSSGTRECQDDGSWGECSDTRPEEETCDGEDDDCDGSVDEKLTEDCAKQEGVCSGDTVACSNGTFPTCDAEQYGDDYEDGNENSCNDGLDNDCDGSVDCADADCDGATCGPTGSGAVCSSSSDACVETACQDGEDNDGDGNPDCLDSDCDYCGTGATCDSDGVCHETACNDGVDNDEDGLTDCEDPDCDGATCGPTGSGAVCSSSAGECVETACQDDEDNDGDGLTDCEDPDCDGATCGPTGSGAVCSSSAGECVETACQDGDDNDGDGNPDCLDSDCDYCGSGATCDSNGVCHETACDDGIDNDEDGVADRNDADCQKLAFETCSSDSQCINSGQCVDGECAQLVFVSSDSYTGDLGGASGGDSTCGQLASDAGLSGNWRAILSTSAAAAKNRVTVANTVYNTAGSRVATASQFWGNGIDNAVQRDEDGSDVGAADVWTGTRPDGTYTGAACEDWTSSSGGTLSGDTGTRGSADLNSSAWIDDGDDDCDAQYRLYCIDGQ